MIDELDGTDNTARWRALRATDLDQEQNSREELNAVRALSPLFFYFVSAGVVTVMLGPLLPTLIQRWQIRDAQAGTLFLASFLGQLCGSWVAARNPKASVVYGAALTAAGCLALAWVAYSVAHLALFATGFGLGTGITAGNIIAGTMLPASRGRLLSVLNVAWSLGAVACPLLIRFTASSGMQPFLYLAAACLAVSSLICMAIPPAAYPATVSAKNPRLLLARKLPRNSTRFTLPLSPRPLLVFCAAMFLYIGIENSLGGWLPSYALRTHSSLHAPSIAFLFWTAELAGRLLVVALISALSERALYRLCLTSLVCMEVLLCTVPHPSAGSVVLLTVFAAFSLAPVYPLILSFLLARTGNHAHLGIFFAIASCGGAILPWLTGVFSTHLHGLRAGLIVPAVAACLLLALSSTVTATLPVEIEVES